MAPPPEGTFDIDDQSVPLKSNGMSDASPQQAPLLAKEEGDTSTAPSTSKSKVSLTWYSDVMFFSFLVFTWSTKR